MTPKPHSTRGIVALRDIAEMLRKNGLLGRTSEALDKIADDLEEQLEAQRAKTQEWYDWAHSERLRANRAEWERDALRLIAEAARPFQAVASGHPDYDGNVDRLCAAFARLDGDSFPAKKPDESRDGMVEVYGSTSGEYLGCMGVETWRNYLAEEQTRQLFSRGLCHVERDIHFHGQGDTCECGARPNTAWAGETPFSKGEPAQEVSNQESRPE